MITETPKFVRLERDLNATWLFFHYACDEIDEMAFFQVFRLIFYKMSLWQRIRVRIKIKILSMIHNRMRKDRELMRIITYAQNHYSQK